MTTTQQCRGSGWFAVALLALGIVAVTKGPLYSLRRAMFGLPQGRDFIDDRFIQVAFCAVYVALLIAYRAHLSSLWTQARGLLVAHGTLVGWVMVSAGWSVASRRSLEQGFMWALGTLAFMAAAASLSVRQIIVALWSALTFGVAVSLGVGVVGWTHALDRNGDLVGIYFNRNSLGAVAALGVLACIGLILVDSSQPLRWASAGSAMVHGATLWSTGSLTPSVALCLSFLGMALIWFATVKGPRRRMRVYGAAGVAAVVGMGGVLAGPVVARLFGRSTTLTGRTDIWAELIVSWSSSPLVGRGFMAVWFEPDLRRRLLEIGRNVHEAHNGYIEVLVGVGIIGVLFLAAVVGLGVAAVMRPLRRSNNPLHVWMCGAVIFVVVANLGETYVGANLVVLSLFVVVTTKAQLMSRSPSRGNVREAAPGLI